jgi:hypothetical protein
VVIFIGAWDIKDLVPLQSKFFPAKFSFLLWKREFWREKLLFKRVNLLCKEGFSGHKGTHSVLEKSSDLSAFKTVLEGAFGSCIEEDLQRWLRILVGTVTGHFSYHLDKFG